MPTSARTAYDGISDKRRGDVGIAPYKIITPRRDARYIFTKKGIPYVTTFSLLLGGVPAAAERA